jgi:hypothetical protein
LGRGSRSRRLAVQTRWSARETAEALHNGSTTSLRRSRSPNKPSLSYPLNMTTDRPGRATSWGIAARLSCPCSVPLPTGSSSTWMRALSRSSPDAARKLLDAYDDVGIAGGAGEPCETGRADTRRIQIHRDSPGPRRHVRSAHGREPVATDAGAQTVQVELVDQPPQRPGNGNHAGCVLSDVDAVGVGTARPGV